MTTSTIRTSSAEPTSARAPAVLALRREALAIVVVYTLVGALWIGLSDRLLDLVVDDPRMLVRIGMFKGMAFVLTTASLLYALLRRHSRTLALASESLARKEAESTVHESQRRRAEAIIASSESAIVSTTTSGLVTSWNAAAREMFGYTDADILGRSIGVIRPAGGPDALAEILPRIARGEHVAALETERVHRDGHRVPVSITFSPIWTSAAPRALVGVSQIIENIARRKEAEAEAEAEREFASTLIEAMPGIFYFYDSTGRFLRWNRNMEAVSGMSAEALRDAHPLDFFRGEDRALVEARIAEVFERGESSVEATFVAQDGTGAPYFFTGRRMTHRGSPCLLGVGLDMSHRKQAEDALRRSEERYRSTLENILEGCQILDAEWRYLYLNPAAAIQNRRPNEELLGRTMHESWPGIEGTRVHQVLGDSLARREPRQEEVEFVFPDGERGWFDMRVQPVPEGIFVLSMDITERKRAEHALLALNEELERKVVERTRDFEAACARAESADRLKSAFLATMSHELRTPLNSIIGFTGIVLQGLAGPLNDEQAKQLGMVRSSARHLLALINDVLDISKIEAGQLEIRAAPFDPRAALEHVAATVQPLAAKKSLDVRVEMPEALPELCSDRRRFEQIALNLLNNAIKFTDRGAVTLTARLDHEALRAGEVQPVLRVRVSDTGVGIQEADLSKLFLPFRQIDSGLQRAHDGTGLGLAICSRLVGLLGGRIGVESRYGEGSVFEVVLPLHREGAA